MNNIGSSQSSFANVHYFCSGCGRDLWDKHRRLRNPHRCPNVNKLEGKVFCDNCVPSNTACSGLAASSAAVSEGSVAASH